MKHTISVLVENKFGVLARVAGLFSARGYNIASLAVSQTLDPLISYMTIVVDAKDEAVLEQIKKQLNKLIDVVKVTDYTKKEHVDRELVLVKINCSPREKNKLEVLLSKFVAQLVRGKGDTVIVEAVGDQSQIKQLLELLNPYGIQELVRTGRLAIGVE
jgi:acetolactate synthase-1/3 small subunit